MNFDNTAYKSADGQCIDQITGLLYKIKDPVHLANVHDWVVKLTTGEPDTCKTNHLRLLEYALKSDDVREPFTEPPPDSPLSQPAGRQSVIMPSLLWHLRTAAGGCCGFAGAPPAASATPIAASATPVAASATPVASSALAELMCRTDGQTTSVQKFVADAGPLTCDRGVLMGRVADEWLGDFGRTVGAVFDERTQKLCDALSKEQVALLLRYRTTAQRMLTRAQILQDHVRESMPTFQYDKFLRRPDEHIAEVLRAKKTGSGGGADGPDQPELEPELDDSAAMQQKKLMCALQWLRSEVERADCENVTLVKRYDAAVAAIVMASNKKIANECRAKARKLEVQTELDEFRKESAKQEALIDCYIGKMSL